MLTLLLLYPALFFVGMGVIGLVRPAFITGIFGAKAETPSYRAEVRAVYGGFGVVIGAAIISAPYLFSDIAKGLVIGAAISVGGMALGRLVSAVVERQGALYPTWFFLLVEISLALSLAAWARLS
jgi:hypothetical protein